MKKLLCLVIFSCFCLNIISAFSRAKERFIIENFTGTPIIVKYEFLADPFEYEGVLVSNGRVFQQQINGINISISDELYDNTIAVDQQVTCISYYPSDNLLSIWENNDYERLSVISIIDKLNVIFKSFTITDMDGNVFVTLETLREDNFRKEGDNEYPQYILEIYDDLR